MNVGNKIKLNMEYGSVRTPFPVLHTGYEDYLRKLTAKYYMWLSTNSFTSREEGLEEAREMMQQHYPGNYRLEHVYNYSRGAFELAVKFDNPKEEMLWKMKWA